MRREGRTARRAAGALAAWALFVSGCGTPQEPTSEPARAAEATPPRDLFPELSAGLERQMAAQREAALARGAEEKAKQLDPFSAQGLEDRLDELGVHRFGGCAIEGDRLAESEAMVRYRLLGPSDYRAREPTFREGGPSRRVDARAAIVPVVVIACVVDVDARPVARGGFVATPASLEYVALFDRILSWWNPERAGDETARLHGQLHFDVAHLLAKEANRPQPRPLVGRGPTEAAARDDLKMQLADRLGGLERELQRITGQIDLETTKGFDVDATVRWEDRVRHGLRTVRRYVPSEGGER